MSAAVVIVIYAVRMDATREVPRVLRNVLYVYQRELGNLWECKSLGVCEFGSLGVWEFGVLGAWEYLYAIAAAIQPQSEG